ncbi:hypothetical protein FACS1894110_05920 [Spirochaetia bacterium]|nr:hypothetical protein FACS1894110_05920 [Spirochaetia bacterium]
MKNYLYFLLFLLGLLHPLTAQDGDFSQQSFLLGGRNSAGNSTQRSNYNPIGERADPDAAHWDIPTLDTAKDVDYLTGIEKDVILEMNKVRSDPAKYAELYIKPRFPHYNDKRYMVSETLSVLTKEGRAAAEECYNALKAMQGVQLLFPERGLALAAKDHVMDIGQKGQMSHTGSDGGNPVTRAEKYGAGYKNLGENITYGTSSGRDIVVDLLIDDGIPDRGHRDVIMLPGFTQTGVSTGAHTRYGIMCVIDYASGYVSN